MQSRYVPNTHRDKRGAAVASDAGGLLILGEGQDGLLPGQRQTSPTQTWGWDENGEVADWVVERCKGSAFSTLSLYGIGILGLVPFLRCH